MRKNKTNWVFLGTGLLAAVILALGGGGVALAQPLVGQDLSVTPVSSGINGTAPAQRSVIQSTVDYSAFFGGSPPATPAVDFTKEDVIAVSLGSQPAGSSVSIPRIEVRTTGFTAGWGIVHVAQVIGTGGGGTGPVTISGGTITNTGGSTQNLGGTTVIVGGTTTLTTTINGGVATTTVSSTGGATTITAGTTTTTGGTTTAVAGGVTTTNTGGVTVSNGGTTSTTNDVSTSGGTVSTSGGTAGTSGSSVILTGGTVTIVNGTVQTSGITTTNPTTTTITGGTTSGGTSSGSQPYAVVKVAKGALAYSFVTDAAPSSVGTSSFSKIVYSSGGGSAPYTDSVTIDSKGNITVNRSTGTSGGTSYHGTLAKSELSALGEAFKNANPAALPVSITDPSPATLTGVPAETIVSTTGGATYTATVQRAGYYGSHSPVKALVDAIRLPTERTVRSTQGWSISGKVTKSGTTLKVGTHTISTSDPFYNLIASATGKSVELESVGGGSATAVVSVDGKLTVGDSLVNYPSAGSSVISALPAGTHLTVTDFTLYGSYLEVSSHGQRGYVHASVVSIKE